jgi:hydrogenase/urease accessory protein HupE
MTARRALTAGLVLTAVAAAVSPAFAHTGGSNGYASIAIGQGSIRYSLTLWPSTLPPAVAEELRLARGGRADSRDRLLGFIHDKVTLVAQGRRCAAGPGLLLPPPPHGESVTLVVDFVCTAAAVRDLLIRDDLFDVLGADYHTLARIEAPGFIGQFAFSPETRETRLRLGGADERGAGTASFFLLGVEHILSGYDHLLFLLALLLGGGGFVAMLKIVTAFTLAHSVTLALAVLDVVVMPDRLVEAAIALSIAVVAAENLVRRRAGPPRWVASFVFGLVHGFGFSSALRELGLPREGLALALLGFNLGVEAGQALVVALALPLLLGLRRTRWEWRVVAASSAAILLVGLILLVERAAGW